MHSFVQNKTKECKHTYICIHEYVYICTHICKYINVYTHTNTHTNTMLVDSSLCKDSEEAGNNDCLWGLKSEVRKILHNLPFAAFYKHFYYAYYYFFKDSTCVYTHTELENMESL